MTANITPEGLRERADWLVAPDDVMSPFQRLGPLPTMGFMLRAHAAALEERDAYKDATEKRTEERDHAMLREDTLYFEVLEYVESGKVPEKAARALAIVDAIKRQQEAELSRLKAPVEVAGIVAEQRKLIAMTGGEVANPTQTATVAALESLAAQLAVWKGRAEEHLAAVAEREQQLAERDADLKAGDDAWHAQEEELQALRVEIAALKGNADIEHDRAYANGLDTGWNFGVANNYEGYMSASSALRKDVSAAYPKE